MFQGFSNETIDFMWGIRFNNEKSWFEQHKETYRAHFYEPMKALAAQVYEIFQDRHGDLELATRVSRIYRDARRLRGRGPYKDRLWFSMERPSEAWTHDPVFWFELSPEQWTYGMGVYCAHPVTAAKLRARMDADPGPMEKLTRRLNAQTEFVLEGPEYARAKTPSTPLLASWYNKKNYDLIHREPISEALYDKDLPERIFSGWRFLMPFYEYLSTLSGDPDPRDP